MSYSIRRIAHLLRRELTQIPAIFYWRVFFWLAKNVRNDPPGKGRWESCVRAADRCETSRQVVEWATRVKKSQAHEVAYEMNNL